ncbi:MAG: hypothetical protein KDJ35_07330 [Alphaproteobacteria bacterium]|nr:hypothetical protein [Alphaproteobacteria bacterium]
MTTDNSFAKLKEQIEYIGEKTIKDIHKSEFLARYNSEFLRDLFKDAEKEFSSPLLVEGVKKSCGKIIFPNFLAEGLIHIKDELKRRNYWEHKKGWKKQYPHLDEYINDYNFKKTQKKLQSIFQESSAAKYTSDELRKELVSLETYFNRAHSKGWDDKFFGGLYRAVNYVKDEITRQDPTGVVPFRHIPNVLSTLDRK